MDPEKVRLIFKDTYNFYLKWRDMEGEVDITKMWDDAKEINSQYCDCELCRHIMTDVCNIIEQKFRPGGNDGGSL